MPQILFQDDAIIDAREELDNLKLNLNAAELQQDEMSRFFCSDFTTMIY